MCVIQYIMIYVPGIVIVNVLPGTSTMEPVVKEKSDCIQLISWPFEIG